MSDEIVFKSKKDIKALAALIQINVIKKEITDDLTDLYTTSVNFKREREYNCVCVKNKFLKEAEDAVAEYILGDASYSFADFVINKVLNIENPDERNYVYELLNVCIPTDKTDNIKTAICKKLKFFTNSCDTVNLDGFSYFAINDILEKLYIILYQYICYV